MSNQLGSYLAVIKVVGIGGGGTNAVTRMVEAGLSGVEFVAVNTDAQALLMTEADEKIHIGSRATRGLGAGRRPARRTGRGGGEPRRAQGGAQGRGHGVRDRRRGWRDRHGRRTRRRRDRTRDRRAHRRRRHAALRFEGKLRADQAEQGIQALRDSVDALIVIENDRLLQVVERSTPVTEAFGMADDILRQGVQGITDLITVPGLINLDFADVRTIMKDAGSALMGIGVARGENRAVEAARAAISSPLLEQSLDGATGILLNITGGPELGLAEVDEAAEVVRAAADSNANVIFGAAIDEGMGDEVASPRSRPASEPARRADAASRRPSARPSRRSASGRRSDAPSVHDVEIDIPSFLKED